MRFRSWWRGAALACALTAGSSVVGSSAVAETSAQGGSPVDAQVVAGKAVTYSTQFPWMAALLQTSVSDGYAAQFCGGTLISPSWVVTAAHCVVDTAPSTVRVALKKVVLTSITSADRRVVNRISVHPQYNPATNENDVAMLHLSTPVPSSVATPLPTIPNASYATDGRPATVVGWGSTRDAGGPYPNQMRYGGVRVIGGPSTPGCGAYATGIDYFVASMLCAGLPYPNGGVVDTCSGDSGGPLFITVGGTRYLAGITSWGEGCAEAGFPGVYTRVSAVRSWTITVMRRGF